jgi:hypothetical protein
MLLLVLSCGGCTNAEPTAPKAQAAILYERAWHPLSYGTFLSPERIDDRCNVIFHFHAGKAAEQDYRASGVRAVIVDVTLQGFGTTPYWDLMDDPTRFDAMKRELAHALSTRAGREVSLGRIALVSWSAGYASVQRIIAAARHYESIDAVILLDGPHTGWIHGTTARRANLQTIAPFVRFMRDARDGKKLFVMTHSSIVPGDYASTTEVADALALDLGAPWSRDARPGPPNALRSADLGDAHLRGFAGQTARDHVRQVHFVRDVLRTWLAPRWR